MKEELTIKKKRKPKRKKEKKNVWHKNKAPQTG